MDKKRSSLGLNLSSKKEKSADNEVTSGFHSPVSNKSTSLYKSVLKDSVGKSTSSSHSKVRFSLNESIKESPREQKTSEEFDFHCSFDSNNENSPNNSFSCTQPVSQDAILQGVVAYIEARSNTENRFEGISKQMELLGAVVVKKFIPEVTHVIFKDGKKSTRQKALKKGIHLVNVLWVESCRQSGKRVPEDLFPVVVPDEVHTPVITGKLKRTKSMQPRNFEEDVKNSAERLNRKRQRKIAAPTTPTSILSPLTLRLLSEDSPAPASPLVRSSMKHVPGTPGYSEPNSPSHQEKDSEETELPSKRLNFVDTPVGSSAPIKTPASPKTIPTDILQTASGPGKKRKRVQSSRESTSNEPDEKPKQNKKNKSTKSPLKNTDVFTFDEEDLPDIKTSKLKRNRKPRSKSTSGTESKIEEDSSSAVRREDELENDLRVDSLAKKSKGKTQEVAPLTNRILSPSSTSGKVPGSRDVEKDFEHLVSATGLSDSGVSFSEMEVQEKSNKILKKNKKKFKKTEKMVGEVLSTEDEKEIEDVGTKESEPLKSTKRTYSIGKKTTEAKRGKKSVPKTKKETETTEVMVDKDYSLPTGVCKATEDDEKKNNDVKKTKLEKEKNDSRKKKPIRKIIPEDTDDDIVDKDDDNDDNDNDDSNGKGKKTRLEKEKNDTRRKKPIRKIIPEDTDDDDNDDDVVDKDEVNDDNDDGNGKGKNGSRRKKYVRKPIPKNTDDEDDSVHDNNNNDGGADDDNGKGKNHSRPRKKYVRKPIPKNTDDEDDRVHDNNNNDGGADDDNGKGKNHSRPRKKDVRKTIPKDTDDDDEDDRIDNDNSDDDGDDDHIKKISRKNKSRRKTLSDTDDDDDNLENDDHGDDDDDRNDERITEDDGDESEINEGDYGEKKLSHKPKEKQKPKGKSITRKKPSRSLVLTSMPFSEQDIVISVVRKLGGFYIADAVGPSTTHVISGSPRRTLNVLMAIAQGNWLVSPEWVMKSLETGYWVDEEPYELADAFPSAQLSRLERVSSGPDYRQELFADVDPIFVSDNTSPPRDKLLQLIALCGGKICTSIRKAGVVVGSISRKTKATNVSERWVLDSITEHTALSFNPYVFNSPKSTSPTF